MLLFIYVLLFIFIFLYYTLLTRADKLTLNVRPIQIFVVLFVCACLLALTSLRRDEDSKPEVKSKDHITVLSTELHVKADKYEEFLHIYSHNQCKATE